MSKETEKFWKFHSPENMDVHTVSLINLLDTKYDTLHASHTKLVDALRNTKAFLSKSPYGIDRAFSKSIIKQALSEAEKIT